MIASPRKSMTLVEFLAWEERQEVPFEFDGCQPVAMTGGTGAHERIGGTLRALLYLALRGKPCDSWGPTMKIQVLGRIRYPDAFVTCSAVPPDTTIAQDPVVVFEVVSPGTSRTDRIEKLREYQATRSIRRYVILEQDSIAATVFARRDNGWDVHPVIEGETLSMPEIGVDLTLADIYTGLDLSVPGDRGEEAASG